MKKEFNECFLSNTNNDNGPNLTKVHNKGIIIESYFCISLGRRTKRPMNELRNARRTATVDIL